MLFFAGIDICLKFKLAKFREGVEAIFLNSPEGLSQHWSVFRGALYLYLVLVLKLDDHAPNSLSQYS